MLVCNSYYLKKPFLAIGLHATFLSSYRNYLVTMSRVPEWTEISYSSTPPKDEWQCFKFHFSNFESLPSTKGLDVTSSQFTCFGKQWELRLYPGGDALAKDRHISLHLKLCSKDCSIIIDYGIMYKRQSWPDSHSETRFDDLSPSCVWRNFAEREHYCITIDDTLTIGLIMKLKELKNLPFIPENHLGPMLLKLHSDEESADIVFEVEILSELKGKPATKSSSVRFYAHRLILQACAPSLATLCETYEDLTPVPITGTKPAIFRHLLHYVYSGKIEPYVLKTNVRDLLDAADKYGIVNLKLEAEACIVRTANINFDNVHDNLHYATAKSCALLKETIMDFIVENGQEALDHVLSMREVVQEYPSLFVDLLAAMVRAEKKDTPTAQDCEFSTMFSTMQISTLRKKLHEKGLCIDGSRETLIAALEENLTDSDSDSDSDCSISSETICSETI